MNTILIGIDFSECGQAALAAGVELAIDLNADVRLVHAFPNRLKAPPTVGLGHEQLFRQLATTSETDEAVQFTFDWAEKARLRGCNVDVVTGDGPAAGLILEASEAEDVAMIIVGTHGKSGFKKFMLGSVAETVVQKSKKPVLVIPCN